MACWRMRTCIAAALLLTLIGCGGDGDSGGAAQPDLTVANLNFLHGFTGQCGALDHCRLEERADLLFQWIAASGCPDVVTLQEVWRQSEPLIMARLAGACPFAYTGVIAAQQMGIDEEMVLSRHPVLAVERKVLFPGFRHALFVRIDHPLGPIDVFTTHLASGSDGAQVPCATGTPPCPAECLDAGAAVRRDCQAVQLAAFVAARHDGDGPAVVTGDFNSEPGSFVYRQFTDRGWTDVYLAAGNPECDPASGIGCTSGRQDQDLTDLESPDSNQTERIDFIFLVPPAPGFPCRVEFDPAADRDGDDTATRIFTDRPNPFAPRCGPAPDPICWPSDHEGVELDLNCGRAPAR